MKGQLWMEEEEIEEKEKKKRDRDMEKERVAKSVLTGKMDGEGNRREE